MFYGIRHYPSGHQHRTTTTIQDTKSTNPNREITRVPISTPPPIEVSELTTPEEWLRATQAGRVNFTTIQQSFLNGGLSDTLFDRLVSHCQGVPTF